MFVLGTATAQTWGYAELTVTQTVPMQIYRFDSAESTFVVAGAAGTLREELFERFGIAEAGEAGLLALILNRLGSDGWELVAATRHWGRDDFIVDSYLFKRALPIVPG